MAGHDAEERARRVNSYTRSGRPIARRLDSWNNIADNIPQEY